MTGTLLEPPDFAPQPATIFVVSLFQLVGGGASGRNSNTLADVDPVSDMIWKFQRYELVMDFAMRRCLPPPLNAITYVWLLLTGILRLCATVFKGKRESWRLVPEPVLVPLVVESWRRVPEPALAPLFQEGWRGFPRRTTGAQGHNSPPPEHVSRRLQFLDSGAEPLEFDAATLRLPTSSLQVTTPPIVDFATECCRRGINDGPGYYPDDLNLREVRRSRQDYLVGRLAHRYDPGHVATLVLAEWTAQPPLDDRSRRAGAWFLNLSLSRWSWRAGAGCLNLPLRRCSRRAGVGFRGGLQVLKGTTPRRRNT
ncbi:hypothetical protein HPB51_008393 [Rhipicephalus microplus]|uniref:Uncharacterized protein n=1 Tax=Rhipicephalus microplus TaxID=6941 RepID=A0A9J6DU48_RHIMP|nr:hypothetical protein HPB51_008393 [Rhipicephalus microplus]